MGDSPPAVFAALDRRLMAGIPYGMLRAGLDGRDDAGQRTSRRSRSGLCSGLSRAWPAPERSVPESGLSPNGLFLVPQAFRPLAPGRDRGCRAW